MSGLKIRNVILQGRWIWSEVSGNWNSIQREGALQSPLTITTNRILAGHNRNKIIQRTPEKERTARQTRLFTNRYYCDFPVKPRADKRSSEHSNAR